MVLNRRLVLAGLGAGFCLRAARADAPLPAPETWRMDFGAARVVGDTRTDSVRVANGDTGTRWSIPGWRPHWSVHPAPDGSVLLFSNPGGNLIATNDPDHVVLEVVAAPGDHVAAITLAQVAVPARLQRTASNYLWITGGYRWSGSGWDFEGPDGRAWAIAADGRLARR